MVVNTRYENVVVGAQLVSSWETEDSNTGPHKAHISSIQHTNNDVLVNQESSEESGHGASFVHMRQFLTCIGQRFTRRADGGHRH
jgi:hypothetical protein